MYAHSLHWCVAIWGDCLFSRTVTFSIQLQGCEQAFGRFQIRRIEALRERLEYRLQGDPGSIAPTQRRPQDRQTDSGRQLP
jgi:hypothetical protein